MKLHNNVKSISYVKAHASEILNSISETHSTYVITQNGEAKAVIQDLEEYDKLQESLSMLKLIAQGANDIEHGRIRPIKESFSDIRRKTSSRKTAWEK